MNDGTVARITEEEIEDVIAQQGWNDRSIVFLLREFIREKGLDDALVVFLQERADTENGRPPAIFS